MRDTIKRVAGEDDQHFSARERQLVIGPAYSAQGQVCAQCGRPAWNVHYIPFCCLHGQGSMSKAMKAGFDPNTYC